MAVMPGTAGDDVITGTPDADTISTLAGNDTIIGFVGADSVNGGIGNDTIVLTGTSTDLNAALDAQIVAVEAVTAAGAAANTVINLGLQSEGFVITGSAYDDTITGGAFADIISAGAGNDTINNFIGADIVDGGDGDDTLKVTATSATLNVATDAKLSNVEHIDASDAGAGITLNLSSQTEGFDITGGAFNDNITGTAAIDTIQAGDGNDTINTFSTGDQVDGGSGNDTLVLKTLASVDALNNAADGDVSDVEAITVGGVAGPVALNLSSQSEGFRITATSYLNTITGGKGDDTIVGFIATDTIDGNDGNDTIELATTSIAMNIASDSAIQNVEAISAAGAKAAVTINLSNQTEAFDIVGSAFADAITGTVAANTIFAGGGNDIINGFTFGDEVDGGANDDRIVLTGTSLALNTVADDKIVSVEMVTFTGATAGVTLDLSGQSEGFSIVATGFADIITGGQGTDKILAGSGDDTINGFLGMDKVDGGVGTDTLVLTDTSFDLNFAFDAQLLGIEIVTAAGAAGSVTLDLARQKEGFVITGSSNDDVIRGGTGADVINAGDGNDTISGFSGADRIDGGIGNDQLVLTATSTTLNKASDLQLLNVEGIDASTSGAGVVLNLVNQTDGFTVTGSNFADTITGSKGNDILAGGVGNDKLNGGLGDDTFVFNFGDGADTITGFVAGAATDDAIDLSSFAFADFATVMALTSDSGGNAIINCGNGDTLTLLGVTKAQLHQDDFILV